MSDATKLIKNLVPKDNHWKIELLNGWQQISLLINNKVIIEAILDKTLVLAVPHPAIAQQLAMHSVEILQKISTISPHHHIERLAFRTIEIKKQNSSKKKCSVEDKQKKELQLSLCNLSEYYWKNIILNPLELKSLNSVCCQRLKKLLQKFYAKCKRREMLNVQTNQEPNESIMDFAQPHHFKLFSFN